MKHTFKLSVKCNFCLIINVFKILFYTIFLPDILGPKAFAFVKADVNGNIHVSLVLFVVFLFLFV